MREFHVMHIICWCYLLTSL